MWGETERMEKKRTAKKKQDSNAAAYNINRGKNWSLFYTAHVICKEIIPDRRYLLQFLALFLRAVIYGKLSLMETFVLDIIYIHIVISGFKILLRIC